MLDYIKSARFLESFIVILIGIIALYAIRAFDKKYLHKKSKNQNWNNSAKSVLDFLSVITIIIVVLLVLSVNGINVGKYFASLGIAGVAIAFAAQDLLKDFAIGISVTVENFFKPGDVVIYNNRYGKVISFNLKTTKLKMLDDESLMSVPNRNITEIAVASDWFDVDIPIGYDVDLIYSRHICKECCNRIERLKYVYSADYINTQEFADSWIVYRVRVHCMIEKRFALRRAANAVIQDVFYENNLGFPYSVKILYNMDPDKEVVGADFVKGKTSKELNEFKKVYELGSGAVISKHIKIDKTESSIKKALDEAERYAASENLDKKMRMRMRLLSEEILTLTKSITKINNGEFHIERDDGNYQICIDAEANINHETKEKLVEISSNGTNAAFSGATGSILNAIDSMLHMKSDANKNDANRDASVMERSISSSDGDYRWSLNIFNEKSNEEPENVISSEATKMSVLNNLAEDVKISVKGNNLSIVVLVRGQ